MSIVLKETIEVIAQSIGISNLSPDLLPALASDIEYRLHEIMQEAIKCMRHSKRTTLTVDDVDSALKLRNVVVRTLNYILPQKSGLQVLTLLHLAAPSDSGKSEYREDGVPIDITLPVKHVIFRELQLYFEKITELTVSRSNSVIFKEALVSLATLVPYFTYFEADELGIFSQFPPSMKEFPTSLQELSYAGSHEPYLRLLEPEMQLEKQRNELKRHEAWRVFGALMSAAGLCIYEWLKTFSVLSSRPACAILKSNWKVVTSISRITEGGLSSNDTLRNIVGKREIVGGHLQEDSNILNNHFGESKMSFIPSPELSLFL